MSEQPIKHHIEGWDPPKWATVHEIDNNGHNIIWTRPADTVVLYYDGSIDDEGRATWEALGTELNRSDSIDLDVAGGILTVDVGPTLIRVYEDLELSPAEARKLAAVLVELADVAEAGR